MTNNYVISRVLERNSVAKATMYLRQQKELHPEVDMNMLAERWMDISRIATALGLDLRNRKMKVPADCLATHDELSIRLNRQNNREEKARRLRENKDIVVAIRTVCQKNKIFTHQKNGLIIRPVTGLTELCDEGAALCHCVGGYGKAIADGRSLIFVVRRAENPKQPYFTVEVARKKVTQIRGNRNADPPHEVRTFVNKWLHKVYLKNVSAEKEQLANAV